MVPSDITPITITTSPQSINVAERAPATFTVAARGAPRNYFWFSNNVQVPGNNQPSFTIPSAAYPANNGAQIYVVISNAISFATKLDRDPHRDAGHDTTGGVVGLGRGGFDHRHDQLLGAGHNERTDQLLGLFDRF